MSHDFVRDREVQELRRRFGHWMSDVWLEMLAEADKNEGWVQGDKDLIARSLAWVSLSNRPETQVKHVRNSLDYMEEQGWIKVCTGRVLICKYREYHPSRGTNKSHEGVNYVPSELPTELPSVLPDLELSGSSKKRSARSMLPAPRKNAAAPATINGAVWSAYAEAYTARYGAEPVRNAKVNACLARFTTRVPGPEAPEIAAFYVSHPGALYGRAGHPVELLLRDAEKLRTEWATGRQVTETEAREVDRKAGVGRRYRRVAEDMDREAE